MATETISNRPISFDIQITNVSKNDSERRIVAGYGSLDVIDRQGERITTEAMQKALEKFMANPEFANTHVMHGNVAVGKVIPEYVDKNGEKWETKVSDIGTFIVSELRTDIERANQVWELIKEGKLKSYSVGGLALAPKSLVCLESGTCHWEISELEIHEFSYVDRPAVKGADFVIVKSGDNLNLQIQNKDLPPKAMACPLKKSDSGEQTYKPESTDTDVIIMTDTQAEVSEVTDEPEQAISSEPEEVEEVAEEVVDETAKADADPLLLEVKAQNEKILNFLENYFAPQKAELDIPEEEVKSLQDKYGENNTAHLLNILGSDYARLLDKAEEPEEAPEAEPEIEAETVEAEPEPETEVVEEPAPEAEEAKAEEVAEEVKTEPVLDKSQIIDEIQVAVDAKVEAQVEEALAKYAKVQKRSPVPKTDVPQKPKSLLEKVSQLSWRGVDELAQRGAQ